LDLFFNRFHAAKYNRFFQPLEATVLPFSASSFAKGFGGTGRGAWASIFSKHWKNQSIQRCWFSNAWKKRVESFQGLETRPN